jgi:transposase
LYNEEKIGIGETRMIKKLFTKKKIKLLSSNKYVKSVNLKGITYTDEFKQVFSAEKEKGKFARDIFEESDFDADDLGRQ